jgi:hypothetical protein
LKPRPDLSFIALPPSRERGYSSPMALTRRPDVTLA